MIDEHTLKEPVAGTSKMHDLDSQNTFDDGFGDGGFGRKYICLSASGGATTALK